MNKVMLIGRLGKAPDLKYSQNGHPIVIMNIATDEPYTNRDGNKIKQTEWHRVVAYQKNAENCAKYLTKGSLVFVEGKLQTRKWQEQSGQTRYVTEVSMNRIQFLEKKNSNPTNTHEFFSSQVGDNEAVNDFDTAFATGASEMDRVPF